MCEIFKEEVEDKTAAEVLYVRVTGPTFVGKEIDVSMNNPKYQPDTKKADNLRNRARSIALRTGVLKKEEIGGPVKLDWSKAVGWRGLIVIVADPKTLENGSVVNYTKPDFLPFYPLDHDAVPVHVREALGLSLLPGQVPSASAAALAAAGKGVKGSAAASGTGTTSEPKKPLIDPGTI